VLFDDQRRAALWAELQFALDGEPDPWVELERAQVDARQFEPLPALS
jgi:nitrite reductase (NADH) large subunit